MIGKVNGQNTNLPDKVLEKHTEDKMKLHDKAKKADSIAKAKADEKAYVYEETKKVEKTKEPYKVNKMSEKERAALVERMKKDTEARKAQFIELVNQSLNGQTKAISLVSEDKDGIWKILAKGEFTVDEATKKQAMEDISENGYWGVKETSQRLFDFASALAGDDVEKMKEMKDSLLKGFTEATKAWGKELPEISKKTLDAANKLFDQYFEARKNENKEAMTTQAAAAFQTQAGIANISKTSVPDQAVLGVRSVTV